MHNNAREVAKRTAMKTECTGMVLVMDGDESFSRSPSYFFLGGKMPMAGLPFIEIR